MRYVHTATLAVLAVSVATAAALVAQQQKTDEQPPPRFKTQANFVRVDVYPTADGRPVQDLRKEDFEILEDGAAQLVETFEYVQVRPAGPQTARVEPNSVQAGEQMAANPRNRVFVVFLDVPHVQIESAHAINEPLIRLLDRVLGPDDLVAVMTPSMSVGELTLGRKTEVLARGLRENWPWGERFRIVPMDDWENKIESCYPPLAGEGRRSGLAAALAARRRERMTLEALEDLVRYLQNIREERKAIITITEGWTLFREDERLMTRRGNEEIPGIPPIGVGPGGKITSKEWNSPMPGSKYDCDSERLHLANIDNDRFFRDLLGKANRGNVSFYPVDPRGLPASDNPIGPDVPPPPHIDHAILNRRITILRTLAENTDGLAILNSNDLDRGLRRVSDDLTSYYLLGYYSTNAKLDGGFRQIKVRVKRPGVAVRARRGYQAATADEVAAATAALTPPAPKATTAVDVALSALSRMRPESRLLVNASAVSGASTVWVAGEVTSAGAANLAGGATAEVEVSAAGQSGTARVTLPPGDRTFLTAVALQVPPQGEITVRVRMPSADKLSTTDTLRFDVAPGLVQPMLYRRGASTSNRWRPAADFRFSRTERVRVEVPIPADVKPAGGRVMDRAGNTLDVPITVAERTDEATGQRWVTGEVTLAPLGHGDYAIEIGSTAGSAGQKVVTAIRVGR
jgi:VWFA-related protein